MANVGLVIVSHSARLAEGVCDLARQMSQGAVTCLAAAGLADDPEALGTDAARVAGAIAAADGGAGVLVMADLGSAILSSELAFELLDPAQRARVRLSQAPIVEGAVAAAVRAAAGGSLDEVDLEARLALRMKGTSPASESPSPEPPRGDVPVAEIHAILPNALGLHARPAARLVTTAAEYGVILEVRHTAKDGAWADGRSLSQLATLEARQGDEIVMRVRGERAAEAAQALARLVQSGFGEAAQAEPAPPAPPPGDLAPRGALTGVPVSPGWAVGPAVFFTRIDHPIHHSEARDPESEWLRLEAARAAAQDELKNLHERALARGRTAEAGVLEAQSLLLEDPAILNAVRTTLEARRIDAETAWSQVFSQVADRFRTLSDPSLQGRAADILDIGERLLRWLSGGTAPAPPLTRGILLARDLRPSDLAAIDPDVTAGICIAGGSPMSHAAILARALGIPAAVGFGPGLLDIHAGTRIGLDGGQGWLLREPSADEDARRRRSEPSLPSSSAVDARAPAVTTDGHTVEIAANVGSLAEAGAARRFGAEAIGVLRTEFLFLDRVAPPSEDEQTEAYCGILEAMEGKPVIARTLDIGGDKQVPYLTLPMEDNPFLGQRGLRLSLLHPDIFRTQVRAMLRASARGPIRLLFPMVTTCEELRAAKQIVESVRRELTQSGMPVAGNIPIGIMVEVPSAALLAEHFAREADFLSIGTNDLTQYTMAAERTHPDLLALGDAASPAVLRLIRQVVEAAHACGIWAGVCGEMAADPDLTPILLGLGVDELSMGAAAIPRIKAIVRGWSYAAAQELAGRALRLESARDVRQLAGTHPPH